QGAGKWRSEYSESLIGATVAILADNDDVGRDHVQQVARSLSGKAKSIKVVELPNLPPKGDVSDWLAAGGTADALKLIVEQTPEWQPAANAPMRVSPSSDLPEIDISVKNLKELTQKGWDAITGWNEPPKIFRYGGLPTRIERNDEDALQLQQLNNDRVRHLLARVANWGHPIRDANTREVIGLASAFPPNEVVRDILATPDKPLPLITRIVEIPIFAPDLSLQLMPGYYPRSRTFFSPPAGLVVPDVSLNPSREEIEKSKHLLVTELLGDFPFVGPSEIAHALCLLLLPFLRELIDGPTPLHDIEGPSAGTGKSLLIAVLAYPAIGGSLSMMSEATDEDEIRKRLTSKLRRGPSFIVIDNVRRRLDSGALASALTMQMWEDRLLGSSETILLPIRTAWAVTANNPSFSNEIARRTIRIRLDSKQDRPWLRRNFRHKDLLGWAREHRGELIAAALTLVRAWIAAGQPAGSATLGSYESWSRVFGGLFDVIGLPGFLANIEQVYETSDAEGAAWRGFIRAWWDQFGDREVGVADLFEISLRQDEPLDLGNGTDKAMKTRFGRLLVGARDRQFE
ncbi:MAG: ATPase, partial [Elusimicrobiota bacterium]